MTNIKKFEEFVNEGKFFDNIKSSLSKKFKPGELDDVVQGILDDIQYKFDINKLKKAEPRVGERTFGGYEYITSKGDKIRSFGWSLELNDDERITNKDVNPHYLEDIFNFLSDKYANMKEEGEKYKSKFNREKIRSKYADKYKNEDEERT